ncbi:hypothetical protein [Actinomadura sp. HBU206391]|uniref:hypothetical protein n=1 Tax=Actinomadura sp. HBU206391 TaxID=2731692 RepID=UPI001650688B|nr:hypothetical protein [Actinomadura sp. HBU206391]MBC6462679.1 hypothetical protein [Actinomadura sp. HBU206391]
MAATGSDLGRAVVSNATTQILLRQAPQALDQITEAFALTDGERHLLTSARRGQGLLVASTDRVAFDVVSSQTEHTLASTDPKFLASPAADEANAGVDAPFMGESTIASREVASSGFGPTGDLDAEEGDL